MTTERDIRNQIAYAREKGIEEGMEKGAAQSKSEIARAMLAEGLDVAIIAKCTGLTAEEIVALKP